MMMAMKMMMPCECQQLFLAGAEATRRVFVQTEQKGR